MLGKEITKMLQNLGVNSREVVVFCVFFLNPKVVRGRVVHDPRKRGLYGRAPYSSWPAGEGFSQPIVTRKRGCLGNKYLDLSFLFLQSLGHISHCSHENKDTW